jgi:hypothetical protein
VLAVLHAIARSVLWGIAAVPAVYDVAARLLLVAR